MSEVKKPREFWIRPARNYSEPTILPFDPEILLPDVLHVREVVPAVDAAVEALVETMWKIYREAESGSKLETDAQLVIEAYDKAINE